MSEGPIVINAGPLIALSVAGCLDVLERLFGRVLVPGAVMREVTEFGAGRAGSLEVASAGFLETVSLDFQVERMLTGELGAGEAEVIMLAQARHARLVLIDERRARRIAERIYGLRVQGTAGVLVAAKRRKVIDSVGPAFEAMKEHGYYLAERLVARALNAAGE